MKQNIISAFMTIMLTIASFIAVLMFFEPTTEAMITLFMCSVIGALTTMYFLDKHKTSKTNDNF
jgi:heme/copper-type cytochrome/quinol oxidase subunit 4